MGLPLRTTALAGLLAVVSPLASSLTAQQIIDRGTLVIMQQGQLVGQEEFVVERGRRSGAPDGFTIASVVVYPAEQPTRRLTTVVEFGPDSQPQLVTNRIAGFPPSSKRMSFK